MTATAMFTVEPKSAALGATIVGLDLKRPLDESTVSRLRAALVQHGVIFFPDANLEPGQQVALGRAFGGLEIHAALNAHPEAPEVVVFDTANGGTTAKAWHTDVTCATEPPMGAMLQMVVAPPTGGATHWASMVAAYDALDETMKQRLVGLHAEHHSWWQPVERAVHPVVRVHPESGRKLIFVNGVFTKRIVELDEAESNDVLQALFAHATLDEFTVSHRWQSGDIAFWDNRSTQHRVQADFGGHRRCGHRVAINGDRPY